MASAVARANNGGLGQSAAGFRGKALGQGDMRAKPPEAEELLVFGQSMKAANLPIFHKFKHAKKSDISVSLQNNHVWPRTWRPGAERGLCAFRPGLTTATV